MSRWKRNLRRKLLLWHREFVRRRAIRANGLAAGICADRQTLTIARIIGNDLHPRHAEGQAVRNLGFILENEPDFPGSEKLFVLNRIVDQDNLGKAEELVRKHGHRSLVLPFVPDEYREQACDTGSFGGDDYFFSQDFGEMSEDEKYRARLWATAPKVRYAMNINAARNAALEHGRKRGGWTVVLDGSCILTQENGSRLLNELGSPPFLPYIVIPMRRLENNIQFHEPPVGPAHSEEPQLAIHASAREKFDETYPYGMRDKTSLLDRIGVPGEWDTWHPIPWMSTDASTSPDRHLYKFSESPVLRLSSGVLDGALERSDAQRRRYQSRNLAVLKTLSVLDERFQAFDRERARRIMGLLEQ